MSYACRNCGTTIIEDDTDLCYECAKALAPAQAREDEAPQVVIKFKGDDGYEVTGDIASLQAYNARLAALRSRQSPQAADNADAQALDGIANTLRGLGNHQFYDELRAIADRIRAAAPQPSPQGEDAALAEIYEPDGFTAVEKALYEVGAWETCLSKEAHILRDEVLRLRARLASAGQARDDWKCRYESLDAQGYEIARECDRLKAALASAQSSAQGEEARDDRLVEFAQDVINWAEAYPVKIFSEPDPEKVRAVCESMGITPDAIAAMVLRAFTKPWAEKARAALERKETT